MTLPVPLSAQLEVVDNHRRWNRDWYTWLQKTVDETNSLFTIIQDIQTDIQEIQDSLPLTPEQFGAVGDGVTDDTAAMQDALDAASAQQRTLQARDGAVYKITDELSLGSNTRFEAGMAEFRFDAADGVTMLTCYAILGNSGASTNLSVNADYTGTSQGHFIDLSSSSGYARGDYIFLVSNAEFDPAANDVRFGEIKQIRYNNAGRLGLDSPFRNIYTTAASARVFKLVPQTNIVINGGYWYGTTSSDPMGSSIHDGSYHRHAWLVMEGVVGAQIRPYLVSDFHYIGVTARHCLHVRISGQYRNNMPTGGYGVSIENASEDVFVEGASITNCYVGVAQGAGGGALLGGGGDIYGITRNCGARHCHIRGIVGGVGLSTHPGSEDMVYTDNTIDGDALYGILIDGASGVIADNMVTGTHLYGISVNPGCDSALVGTFDVTGNKVINTINLGTILAFSSVTGYFHAGEEVTQATSGAVGEVISFRDTVIDLQVIVTNAAFDTTHVVTGSGTGATGTPTSVTAPLEASGIFIANVINGTLAGNTVKTKGTDHKPIEIFQSTLTIEGNATTAPQGTTKAALTLSSTSNCIISGNMWKALGTGSSGGVEAMSGGAASDKFQAGANAAPPPTAELNTQTGYAGGMSDWTSA